MNSILTASNLTFLKVEKYQYRHNHIIDFGNCARPHFCLGFIMKGQGEFCPTESKKQIIVKPGDLIFVPMGSKYISKWNGNPEISYISIHFAFETDNVFSIENSFKLQKLRSAELGISSADFINLFHLSVGNDSDLFSALSLFYSVLNKILPLLDKEQTSSADPKIQRSLEFIKQNYKEKITIDMLSSNVQMSSSRFYPFFKTAMGITPIDYINHFRISQAIIILVNEPDRSIESVAEQTGFESSAYFRRVFKKVTGVSPREYKKTSLEI